MKAAIQTIKNHSETIMDAIEMFALNGEVEKCTTWCVTRAGTDNC